jgi:hypothetical protein
VLVVRLAVNESLETPFHVNGGSRRVNPLGGDQGEGGERPRGEESEGKK